MNPMDIYRHIVQLLPESFSSEEKRALARILCEDLWNIRPTDALLGRYNWDDNKEQQLNTAISRLADGLPVQYVTGTSLFCGRRFTVNRNVLIPRPETEDLVDIAEKALVSLPTDARICDACTGSGCIAITLALDHPNCLVEAFDISPEALKTAAANAHALSADVSFCQCNLLEQASLPRGPWHLIVSNPPYVMQKEKATMQTQVKDHEPSLALFVEDSHPLIFYEALARWAASCLVQEGVITCEINALLSEETANCFALQGFHDIEIMSDRYGQPRFITCKR